MGNEIIMNDLLKRQGTCEICKKAPVMYLLIEVLHTSAEGFRMKKLCANCVCTTHAEELREMFPFEEDK